ncbi:single-stranded DNA-binding protein [Neobacillus endophyticus]|uniref:single-stranded DNA-binding protein n=1 Tax=Neobacillus endophyticus TaxID=2738405 RepID=UPI0035E43697
MHVRYYGGEKSEITSNTYLFQSSGVAVATFTLAVKRTYAKPDDRGNVPTDFINCVVWRKPAENVANYLKKGSLAGVDGRIQTRSYDDQSGKKVYVTEVLAETVQFLESKGSGNESKESNQGNQDQSPRNNSRNGNQNDTSFDPFANSFDISGEDLPF